VKVATAYQAGQTWFSAAKNPFFLFPFHGHLLATAFENYFNLVRGDGTSTQDRLWIQAIFLWMVGWRGCLIKPVRLKMKDGHPAFSVRLKKGLATASLTRPLTGTKCHLPRKTKTHFQGASFLLSKPMAKCIHLPLPLMIAMTDRR
jgi:hypothetical protein